MFDFGREIASEKNVCARRGQGFVASAHLQRATGSLCGLAFLERGDPGDRRADRAQCEARRAMISRDPDLRFRLQCAFAEERDDFGVL